MRGVLLTGGGTLAKGVLQVLAIVVLARLLSPEDFGVMAMVFPIIAFATVFQQAGLGVAVLQRSAISDAELSTIFWINALIGLLLAGTLVGIAPLVADFYDEPRVEALTAASGALLLLGAMTSQHMSLLARKLAFGRLATVDVLSLTVGTGVAIAAAWLFDSYWAVFLLSFGTAASMCLLAWTFSGWRPGRTAPLREVKDVLLFGMNITASNLAVYFGQNLDKVLIGRFVGAVALGLYERAYKVVLLPILFVHMPLFRLLVPMLSRSREDPAAYRRLFVLGYQLSLLITVPGTLLLIAAAPEMVLIVLGEQWIAAAPIFTWLAVATLGQLATGPLSMIFVSQDRSREAMLSSVASSLFATLAFAVGLNWGAVGVATALAVSELVRAPLLLWYAGRKGPVGLGELGQALLPFLVVTGLVAVAVWGWRQEAAAPLPVVIGAGAVFYALAAACLLLNRAGRAFLAELLRSGRTLAQVDR